MSFLSLNSWAISVADKSATRGREFIGDLVRSQGAQLRSAQRFDKLKNSFTTAPMKQVDALSLEYLLRRAGWHFSFDTNLYSGVSGVGPKAGYNVSIESAVGTFKFGNKLKAGVATNTVVLEYDLQLTKEWTVLWWQQSGTSGTWNHFAKRSSGNSWQNGVQSNPGTSSMLVTAGVVQLKGCTNAGGTGTTQCFDDVVVLPFYLCDAAIVAFAARASAFSDLPQLYLAGDVERFTSPTQLAVIGEFDRSAVVQLSRTVSGTATWENNAAEVTFNLREV